jgi:glycosyltransferase involved in cell wall biosynthesis
VLVIAPTPFFGDRGCHVRIYEEIRTLRALGIESLVVTYPVGRDLDGVAIRRSVRLPGVAPSALGPSWSRPVLDATLAATAVRAAREFQPDVIHAHLHEGIVVGAVVRALTRVPLLADLQGSLTEELADHGAFPRTGTLAAISRRIEAWLVRRPDLILVSSIASCGLVALPHIDASRIAALPDGVDPAEFAPGPADKDLLARLGLAGKRIVVFLGVLTPYQGVDQLLDAVPRVAEAVPDVHFLVLGYPNEERYRAEVARRGLNALVTLPGRIAYSEAPRWLRLGEVAVSPKQSLTEANGKLLNYMACGLPTVATDTPVNRELLGEAGAYAPVGDVRALADQVAALLGDAPRRTAMSAALRARAEQIFAWPALGIQLAGLYDRVVSAKRTGS